MDVVYWIRRSKCYRERKLLKWLNKQTRQSVINHQNDRFTSQIVLYDIEIPSSCNIIFFWNHGVIHQRNSNLNLLNYNVIPTSNKTNSHTSECGRWKKKLLFMLLSYSGMCVKTTKKNWFYLTRIWWFDDLATYIQQYSTSSGLQQQNRKKKKIGRDLEPARTIIMCNSNVLAAF